MFCSQAIYSVPEKYPRIQQWQCKTCHRIVLCPKYFGQKGIQVGCGYYQAEWV